MSRNLSFEEFFIAEHIDIDQTYVSFDSFSENTEAEQPHSGESAPNPTYINQETAFRPSLVQVPARALDRAAAARNVQGPNRSCTGCRVKAFVYAYSSHQINLGSPPTLDQLAPSAERGLHPHVLEELTRCVELIRLARKKSSNNQAGPQDYISAWKETQQVGLDCMHRAQRNHCSTHLKDWGLKLTSDRELVWVYLKEPSAAVEPPEPDAKRSRIVKSAPPTSNPASTPASTPVANVAQAAQLVDMKFFLADSTVTCREFPVQYSPQYFMTLNAVATPPCDITHLIPMEGVSLSYELISMRGECWGTGGMLLITVKGTSELPCSARFALQPKFYPSSLVVAPPALLHLVLATDAPVALDCPAAGGFDTSGGYSDSNGGAGPGSGNGNSGGQGFETGGSGPAGHAPPESGGGGSFSAPSSYASLSASKYGRTVPTTVALPPLRPVPPCTLALTLESGSVAVSDVILQVMERGLSEYLPVVLYSPANQASEMDALISLVSKLYVTRGWSVAGPSPARNEPFWAWELCPVREGFSFTGEKILEMWDLASFLFEVRDKPQFAHAVQASRSSGMGAFWDSVLASCPGTWCEPFYKVSDKSLVKTTTSKDLPTPFTSEIAPFSDQPLLCYSIPLFGRRPGGNNSALAEAVAAKVESLALSTSPFLVPICGVALGATSVKVLMEMRYLTEVGSLQGLFAAGTDIGGSQYDLIAGIASGLATLHEAGFAHGDLSASTILVDKGQPLLALGGFAQLSEKPKKQGEDGARDRDGSTVPSTIPLFGRSPDEKSVAESVAYVIPKGALGPQSSPLEQAKAADIFAFSLLAFEILSGTRIFAQEKIPPQMISQKLAEGQRPQIPVHWPASVSLVLQDGWGARQGPAASMQEIKNSILLAHKAEWQSVHATVSL